MSVCGVCGRQVETSDSGQAMPCVCIKRPLDAFLAYAVRTCVEGSAARPGLDAPPPDAACGCGRALSFVSPDWCSSCDGGEA